MPNTKKSEHVSRGEVVKAILSGIKKAHKDYVRMSGGRWVWEGPEYWVTTYVAKELWKLCGDGTVVAEESASKMMHHAGIKQGTSNLARDKRFDIGLYFANGELRTPEPRAPIEIKNQYQPDRVLDDVERVSSALSESGMRFGAVAYYYSAGRKEVDARKSVETYAQNIRENAESRAGGCACKSETIVCGNAENAWLAECILIECR